MITVRFQALVHDSSALGIDAVIRADCFGLVSPRYNSTNTAGFSLISTFLPKPTRVERGIEYAFTHYGDLMRRLAD